MLTRAAVALAVTMCSAPVSGRTVVYVDDSAPPGGDGTTWPTAFTFLQDALAAPGPAEIRIAGGTYQPDRDALNPGGTGQRNVSFALANDTVLRGGYFGLSAGKGQDPDDRSDANETILTGDLDGDDEPGFVNNGENSFHVLTGNAVDETAHVDGITVSGGNANGAGPFDSGGGVSLTEGSSPRFDDCRFRDNTAESYGGALNGGAPFIEGGLFFDNAAMRGGAIAATPSQLEDCWFENNRAETGAVLGAGGAVILRGNCDTCRIERCTFVGNMSGFYGGALTNRDSMAELRVQDCVFLGNDTRGGGGALWVERIGSIVTNSMFTHNTAHVAGGIATTNDVSVSNSIFVRNGADLNAGALSVTSGSEIANCTVAYNTAGQRIGGISSGQIRNSIVWGNTANASDPQLDSAADAEYCIVEGGYPGTGNLDVDPLYIIAAAGTWTVNAVYDAATDRTTFFDDNASFGVGALFAQSLIPNLILPHVRAGVYSNDGTTITVRGDIAAIGPAGAGYEVLGGRVSDSSPAIDAANNNAIAADRLDLDGDGDTSEPLPFDFDGQRRFVDDPCSPNTGVPDGSHAPLDIGAREFQPSCPADFDCNGTVSVIDILDLLAAWGVCPGCPEDLNHDGEVAFADLLILLQAWGTCEG